MKTLAFKAFHWNFLLSTNSKIERSEYAKGGVVVGNKIYVNYDFAFIKSSPLNSKHLDIFIFVEFIYQQNIIF